MDIVGLIPAGGIASRLGKIPCSKEIFPIQYSVPSGSVSVVSENLIHYFKISGVENIYFILREGKWDIPKYFGDGSSFGVNIGYLMVNFTYGTPFTLNQAYPFVKDKIIALGFPDIIIEPKNAYARLIEKLNATGADLVLGIFPIENYKKWDMIEFDNQDRVDQIVIKQDRPDLKWGWTNVVWKPSFTEYLNKYLSGFLQSNPDGKIKYLGGETKELYVGDVIQAAKNEGLRIDYVKFEKGNSLDIGTVEGLQNYMKTNLSKGH